MYMCIITNKNDDKEIPHWPCFVVRDTNNEWYIADPKFTDSPTESVMFKYSNGSENEFFKLGKNYNVNNIKYVDQVELSI